MYVVAIDGPDGVGKSTLISQLQARLPSCGVFPSPSKTTVLGKHIREHLENPGAPLDVGTALFYDALATTERALRLNDSVVLLDRWYPITSPVYQQRPVSPELRKQLLVPDITAILLADVDVIRGRLEKREGRCLLPREIQQIQSQVDRYEEGEGLKIYVDKVDALETLTQLIV